jgi:signal peptidase II
VAEPKVEEYYKQGSFCKTLSNRYGLVVSDLTGHLIFWPIMIVGLAFDLWSKHAVFQWLGDKPGRGVSIIDGILALVTTLNEGAAFGIAAGRYYLLIVISIVALVVILAVFLLGSGRQRIVQAALAFFAAGVCGNLWDRAFNGGLVRDFILVTYWPGKQWPAFNVADSMLCIAVGLLILAAVFTDRLSSQKRAQPRK